MFDRVIVTGDLLRPYPDGLGGWQSATGKNVRWLRSLLAPALAGTGRNVRMLAWDESMDPREGTYFETPDLYRAANLPLSLEGWSHLATDSSLVGTEAWEPFLDAVGSSLVLAYELPDSLVAILAGASIPFIDFILHPVRFLDDIVFACRTNVPSFHDVFLKHQLNENDIAAKASLIRAKGAWIKKPGDYPPGTALVLGQVSSDRAMIAGKGRYHSLADHRAYIHDLCCERPKVLFKPHPYEPARCPSRRMMDSLPVVERTDTNFYHLLCSPEIDLVVALNSSGVVEAPFFGKNAVALAPMLYTFGIQPPPGNGVPGMPVPLSGEWIETGFWRHLLDGEPETLAARPIPANRLRRTMNADWGYGFIDQVVA